MIEYKSGDIVRVFYPYTPKAVDTGDNVKGKMRFGLIITAGNNDMVALPILAITSRSGRTRNPNFKLRPDEVRIPEGINFFKRSQGIVPIDGVIKTERIEFFDTDEVSKTLTKVGLDTKISVLEKYKKTMDFPFYIQKMGKESPKHAEVMNKFEQTIIAEKLGFLVTELGEFKYEELENTKLQINKIQDLGRDPYNTNQRFHFYAVELTDEENMDSFFYTFATLKQKDQVVKDWMNPKFASDWMKEDERYYALHKDLNRSFDSEPIPYPNKYESFVSFKRKNLEMEIER